ncbi:flavin reductase (NADPH)-like [Ruditapes philippinarum]|uniref:flavin reductase (NADPH)-like n=1 Tax=Ruditapes philippinarum TaxID=129788 RepID=UPI00295C12A8|nr:flavin reductase (NADPH)-like [Ruditapes philippinarum]
MKIAVLGGTGRSGTLVVNEALERGHDVTAIVRNPDKLKEKHYRLKIVKANIFDPDSLEPHFQGQDAVLSCLGCGSSLFNLRNITFHTDCAKSIVVALRKANVKRYIFMSSWYTKYDSTDPFIINWVVKPLFLRKLLNNMGEMEDFMEEECPDIDYTSVRPPELTNKETTGAAVLFHEGRYVPSEKPYGCCRRDAARFMIDTAESGNFKRKCIAITSG